MTILDLKLLIDDLPDDMQVIVPMNPMEQFNGQFFSPCIEESGVTASPQVESEEEFEDAMEKEKIGIPVQETEAFTLVPCGYFENHSEVDVQMN